MEPRSTARVEASKRFQVAVATSRGKRKYMQDFYSIILGAEEDPEIDFFGVFDGHGTNGERVAAYIGTRLGSKVIRAIKENSNESVVTTVERAFLELDDDMLNEQRLKNEAGDVLGGSTAVCIWMKKGRVIAAHCGDSRAIMSVKGKAVGITSDHKPAKREERRRIEKAGGYIYLNRVQGILAVSRAFGDFRFKRAMNRSSADQTVTALPSVDVFEMGPEVDFFVLTSDGITDVLSNQAIVSMIHSKLEEKWPLDRIAHHVMTACIDPPGSLTYVGLDNVTIVIAIPNR